ncbi:PEP-CTERM sorting domain-containing protein [Derxia lacustris]|uniref:PEP-CTERM sorting domain-containing protein n=1 Tax=Derxia lacustris TaxID=764842 RepID=UPI001F1A112E|nr:PEP-CTERM sorting domain-containing protein [Derxia lacustris]
METHKLVVCAAFMLLGSASAQAETIYTYNFTATVDGAEYCCSSVYTQGEIVHGTFSYVAAPMTTWGDLSYAPQYTFTGFTPDSGTGAITLPTEMNPGDAWSGASASSGNVPGGWNWYGSTGWKTALVFDSHFNTVSEPASTGWAWATISFNSMSDIAAADRSNWINGALPSFSTFTAGSRVAYGSWSAAAGADGYEATITGLTLASVTSTTAAVPEPSSWALMGLGALGLALRRQTGRRSMPRHLGAA